ncbi:Glutamyl-tRNA(Gln) amidotransferase subunit A [Grimontia celer]|uniref:Glutamyl-tRNA(Gln) amidotransferase subunit A n=1 Tax=Grimontia celer TaxID=1796497 RepID=A0A128EVZ6_9GAMM|nr:amidase [Grimontia celer]CZF78360.1 Glutamyl-tRNA(Gln) amidotransferase subunit A [Grimontia celer]
MKSQNRTVAEQVESLFRCNATPVDLAHDVIDRASECIGLNAFVSLDPDHVVTQAKQSDLRRRRGRPLSPIDGVPIAVKDNFLTQDYPTTACSNVGPGGQPNEDATVVANLRAAGAVIVGKTNMHEWAYGATNTYSRFGATINPHNEDCISGGSSGGSGAAVAAGIVGAALGSDTGGSVRIPASACGVYGFKPSYGRASRHGVLALSWSLDAPGLLSSSIDDIPLLLPYFLGVDKRDPTTSNAKPFSRVQNIDDFKLINLVGTGLERSEEVGQALEKVLGNISSNALSATIPDIQSFFCAWETILHCEASSFHDERMKLYLDKFGETMQSHLLAGQEITGVELLYAQRLRSKFLNILINQLPYWDALVLPTLPVVAPRFGEQTQMFGDRVVSTQDSMTWFCWLGNLAGLPAISIPVATSSSGLPIGLMLMGRPGEDEKLLSIAKSIDKSVGYTQRVWNQ